MTVAIASRLARASAREEATGAVLAGELRLAHTHWTRLRGLLGTKDLARGQGLWLKPCNQIHMFGMRYAVDVVFLDESHRVVHTESGLAPWKMSPRITDAESVLELPSGTLADVRLTRGARIAIDAPPMRTRHPGLASGLCNLLVALLYVWFAAAHLDAWRRTGQWMTTVPIIVLEAIMVVLFLTRRPVRDLSSKPGDWVLGIAGTLLPLLMRPSALGPLVLVGRPLQMVGAALAVLGASFLGRSLGLVAANRGVRTRGPYRWVRHPMYVSYLITNIGYCLSYPTVGNVAIGMLTAAAFVARALAEERLLESDPLYKAYLRRVHWRFVPYVY
jgi:protein-S-isoprenylcysteine O-methyltransferase Ste14